MSRRNRPVRRVVLPDPRFNSKVVTKFVNNLMERGKKSLATGIVYEAMDLIAERTKRPPLEVFEEALKNATPMVEVKPRRVGGATYQVPTEVRPERRDTLAIRWLVQNARSRSEKSMQERLAAELFDAAQNRGNAVKKREETHKMAEANRAFAHYRW